MPLTPEQVRDIAVEAARIAAREAVHDAAQQAARQAAHEVALDQQQLDKLVSSSVKATLLSLGIAHNDPIEMQKDFQHLRDWRESMEQVKQKGMLTAVGILVTGALAAIWLGLKGFLNQ